MIDSNAKLRSIHMPYLQYRVNHQFSRDILTGQGSAKTPPDCHQTISSSERKQLIKAEVKSWTSSERPIIVKWHLLSPNRPIVLLTFFLQNRALFVGQVIIRVCQYTGIPVADKLQIDTSCGLVPEQSHVRSSW